MRRKCNAVFAVWTLLLCGPVLATSLPTIAASPTTLTFTFQIGSALPNPQTAQIKASGTTTALPFTITVPPSSQWLIVTPLTGKTGTSVSVRVNPTSLLAGVYTAALQITATGASAPATLTITLVVKNPPPTMTVSPTAINISWQTDQAAPAPVPIVISTNDEPISFQAAASGGPWLTIDRTLGIAMAGSPVTVTATIVTDGLVPGPYTGRIAITSTNAANKSVTVNVSVTVTAGTPAITSIWPSAAPVGSDDSYITIRGSNFFKTSVVSAGTTTLSATWVSSTVLLALMPKSLLATVGTLAVKVTSASGTASNVVNFTVTAAGPQVQMVVNAASFNLPTGTANPRIAPGEIISIFGSGLGPTTPAIADGSSGTYPTTVGTPPATVEFELTPDTWTAVPILMAQENEINAISPFTMTAPGTGLSLRVTYNSPTPSVFTFDAVAADPGIFTADSSGRGQGAILNYNSTTQTYSLNSSSNAAARSSTVVMYLTGAGTATPLPSDGEVVPVSDPAPAVDGTVAVTIGGAAATVQSATLVPGSVAGLVALTVTVPATATPGKALPIVVTIAGQSSPATATMAVK